jgi:uncharacterized protein YecT (DUF1311 family)
MKKHIFIVIAAAILALLCLFVLTNKKSSKNDDVVQEQSTVAGTHEVTTQAQQESTVESDNERYALFATDGFKEIIDSNPIDKYFDTVEIDGSTTEMISKYCQYRDYWRSEIEETILNLSVVLNAEDKQSLKEAQLAWETFMSKNDDIRKSMFYQKNYEGEDFGNYKKFLVSVNQANETKYRALELMEYLYNLSGKVEFVFKP